MYNLKFFKTRLHYIRALLPFLTLRKAYNFLLCIIAYVFRLERSGRVPPVWILILTYRCNLSCIMCQKNSADNNPYKNPKSIDFLKIESLLRKHHKDILLIQLLGGEPLHYPEITKVIKLLDELKIGYCLATNGTLLTPDTSRKLLKNCVWVSVSLDAADPLLYMKIRKGGTLSTISSNLNFLAQLKKEAKTTTPIVNANSTVFTYNIDQLSKLLYFCREHEIKSFSVSGGKLYNTKEVNESHLIRNIKTQAIAYVEEAKSLAKDLNIILRIGLRSLYGFPGKKRSKRTYENCRDLYFEITIQPDLNVAAAGEDYLSMGNFNENNLNEIWNKENKGYRAMRVKRKQSS